MLVVVVILFIVCWGPNLAVEVLITLNLQFFDQVFLRFKYATSLLPFIHCCINPLIYSFMSKNFRKSMWRVVARSCPCCQQLALAKLNAPMRTGCCKCVLYGDGCCSGGNNSHSGGGCSKMCCDKQQSSTSNGPAGAVVGGGGVPGVGIPVEELKNNIGDQSFQKGESLIVSTASSNHGDPSQVIAELVRGPIGAATTPQKPFECGGVGCLYACCVTDEQHNTLGKRKGSFRSITRTATIRYSSSTLCFEPPTNTLEMENESNI